MSDLPDRLTAGHAGADLAAQHLDTERTAAVIAAASSLPVTVRLYGIKDVTLPGYLLMWAAGLLLGCGLIALSYEVLLPTTAIGHLLSTHARREPWLITAAIWSPPVLLGAIAFELVEGVIVLSAFRHATKNVLENVEQRC
ncbi:MAG: hypothetical protein ACYTGL_22425 [Planctomycetota bacterium]|jgi:hypothetical protein